MNNTEIKIYKIKSFQVNKKQTKSTILKDSLRRGEGSAGDVRLNKFHV